MRTFDELAAIFKYLASKSKYRILISTKSNCLRYSLYFKKKRVAILTWWNNENTFSYWENVCFFKLNG